MGQTSWRKLLYRNAYALFFSAVSLAALGTTLYTIIDARYQRFQQNQQTLARYAVTNTAQEIRSYLATQQHLLDLFVANHQQDIHTWIERPDNPLLLHQLLARLRLYIPEAIHLSLADADGRVLIPDRQQQLGRNCRLDIRHFASSGERRELFIHRNPHTHVAHIDILTAIEPPQAGRPYHLLASLDTSGLQHLLKLGETLGQHLLMLRRRQDALTIELASSEVARPQDIEQILKASPVRHATDIPETRWRLTSLLDPGVATDYRRELVADALATYALFIAINLIFLFFLFRSDIRRRNSEQEIIELNRRLKEGIRDRTEELERQKDLLEFQATHDHLTGLINRLEFENQLQKTIRRCQDIGICSVILYLDLDQFKVINDTAGHPAGDQLLCEISRILARTIRPQDVLARIGGDEFGIIMPRSSLRKASKRAERIRQAIENHSFFWGRHSFQITTSIGIMPIDQHARDLSVVMSSVDALCYAAKRSGRNQVHAFDPDDPQQSRHHQEMYMASHALRAVQEDRLVLHYQKVLPLQESGAPPLFWAEVLVRIRDGEGALVHPGEFIPALESYGGIRKLDRKVLEIAIRHLAKTPGCRFSINISRASISDKGFASFIVGLIRQYGVAPDRIVLEITETATVLNLEITRAFIAEIKQLGCQVALDDFGSGMSSFSFLSELDFDYIKLDGSFVRNIDQSPTNQAIVQAICSVSRVMGKKTIAEFVENASIARQLSDIGIDYAQGYHLHRPEALYD